MQHNLRKLNSINYFISCLLLSFSITATGAYASGIPTQKAPKVLQLGNSGAQTLALPSDIAIYRNKIYVVDGTNHRIMAYDLNGKLLFHFSGKGSQPGELNSPLGIDTSPDGKIYITDSGNKRIQIFSAEGKFVSGFNVKIGKKSVRPVDVIYHSRSGNIIVSGSNHYVMTFSPKGKLLKKWGGNGISKGEFRYPATISELKDGRIAVVDVLNSRVQVFNPDGSVSITVGQWGVLPGQLFRPKGIAIDKKGNFYISDSYMNVLQKYSDSGKFIAVLGNKGKPYKMQTPVGMTVYKDRLYVVEMRNHLVSVYKLVN
ncbi:hypothetical protein MNBD_GAMMA09-814 [hydrothermal vent metagenome]|uniref:NHL repeat domain protein n=1 Tax=hydrothermal vent metagenome TaxID=652676 RepID=A0A3B0X543_9ZZZZ